MRRLEIYEPPLCCPTGVCGPAPDPALAMLQEDILRWKKAGVVVERLAINQVPQRFMANPTVVDLLTREGQEVLPIALLDGDLAGKDALERVGRELFGDSRVQDDKMVTT